jgi:hypothetical protein
MTLYNHFLFYLIWQSIDINYVSLLAKCRLFCSTIIGFLVPSARAQDRLLSLGVYCSILNTCPSHLRKSPAIVY